MSFRLTPKPDGVGLMSHRKGGTERGGLSQVAGSGQVKGCWCWPEEVWESHEEGRRLAEVEKRLGVEIILPAPG